MNNTFWLVRHGESVNNVLGTYNTCLTTLDQYGLTDTGKRQIMASGGQLEQIDKIYTSPFRRTIETAEIFRDYTNADLHVDLRLREIDLGHYHDQPHIDLPLFGEDESMFGGESIAQIRDRMLDFVQEVDQLHENHHILVVTHGGPLAILKHYWHQEMPFQFTGIQNTPPNGVITKL